MERNLYRIFFMLFAVLLITGCAEAGTGENLPLPETESETEWVGELEENGIPALKIRVFAYDEATGEDVLTELKPGEPVIVRYGGGGDCNIAMEFDFPGGLVDVVAEDNMIQISMGQKEAGPWDSGDPHEERTFGFGHQIAGNGYLSLYPLWGYHGTVDLGYVTDVWGDHTAYDDLYAVEGTEYWLSVHASEFHSPEKPILFARVRMIQHEETMPARGNTRFHASHFTVELIEYELNDTYKMMLE